MDKRTEIFIGIALVITGLIGLISECAAQDNVYDVPLFTGGINRAYDGTNLRPEQAWELTNLVFNPNGIEARQGYSYWNETQISNNEIQAIFIYEPYADTSRLTFGCNGFIYINDDLSDPGTVDWDTLRLSFSDDSLNATASSATITVVAFKDPWWYLKTGGDNSTGDRIVVEEDDSETEYAITKVNWTDDDEMTITPVYAGTTGVEMNYTVYRKILGDPYMTQFRNELYICDSDGFPIIYDDTSYSFVALLDSGIISSVVTLNDTLTVYSGGFAKVEYQNNKAYGNSNVVWQPSWADSTWEFSIKLLCYKPDNKMSGSYLINWSSRIVDVDSANRVLTLEDAYPYTTAGCTQWNPYGLRSVFTAGHGVYHNRIIGCNSDISYKVPKTTVVAADNPYYIFAGGIPYQFPSFVTDDTRLEYPRYKQMTFYNNQMFGLGHRKLVGNYSSRVNDDYDVIWYSHPSIPRYSPALDYNFSLDGNENNNVFFQLRDRLFIGTENSIWEYYGIMGESYLRKAVSNNGIPDIDNFVKSTEEYGYFTNRTGVYRFNGVRPEKISWLVDPIIEDNYNSRIVMVYQNPILYVSFPDSNFTLAFDERFAYSDYGKLVIPSTTLDFGMTCAYAPPDTDIIYFGLKGQNGRIYYYPNGEYWDRNSSSDSSAISITYESGWQSLTEGPWTSKKLIRGYFPVQSDTSFHVDIFADFSGTASDTFTSATYDNKAYRIDELNSFGDYFKTKITATVIDSMIIRPYRLTWQEGDMKEGD
jgi:hypothetical protein